MKNKLINIVYKFTFTERLKNKTPPYYYIGSKTKCYIRDNKIITANGKQYFTSSTNPDVKEIIKSGMYDFEVLCVNDDKDNITTLEREYHILHDVAKNIEYYNKMISTDNPNFGITDHIPCYINGKIDYVHKDFYYNNRDICVGINKDRVYYKDTVNKINYMLHPERDEKFINDNNLVIGRYTIDQSGENNPFYGKLHSDDSKERMVESRRKYFEKHPEEYELLLKNNSEHMKRLGQLPKSEIFLGNLNMRLTTTLYIANKETGECKRIPKDEYQEYKANGWITYVHYMNAIYKETANDITCVHCGFTAKENNSSFHKWHNDKCKKNPINADQWQPWIKLRSNEYAYYIWSKCDVIYDMYMKERNTVTGKILIPKIKAAVIDRELTESEYERFKRLIKNMNYNNFNPHLSQSWLKEFKDKN